MTKAPSQLYKTVLDKRFKKNRKVALGKMIEPLGTKGHLPKGTLVLMPIIRGEIRLKTLDEEAQNRSHWIPLLLSNNGIKEGLSAQYLIWYLTKDFVKDFLTASSIGSIIVRLPSKVIYGLQIPLPTHQRIMAKSCEDSLSIANTPFREMVRRYYEDYRFNYEAQRYQTAIILAGTIAEAVLYQMLLESGVSAKLLEEDNYLALGRLIAYVQLLKMDQQLGFDISPFDNLRRQRNKAVHAIGAIKENRAKCKDDLECFNQIVKTFGI